MDLTSIYCDLETLGLDSKKHAVIEIGAVVFSGRKELAAFSELANPGEEALSQANPQALEVNRIPLEEIHKARPIEAVALALKDFLAKHRGLLHAFPVSFEMAFLSEPPWQIAGPWGECVMAAARRIMAEACALRLVNGIPKRPRLDEAAKFFGVDLPGPIHRSLSDARKAALIHAEIREQRIADDEVAEVIEGEL